MYVKLNTHEYLQCDLYHTGDEALGWLLSSAKKDA